MNDHDVIETVGDVWVAVTCRCGQVFTGQQTQVAKDHAQHFGIEQARAALKGPRAEDS